MNDRTLLLQKDGNFPGFINYFFDLGTGCNNYYFNDFGPKKLTRKPL